MVTAPASASRRCGDSNPTARSITCADPASIPAMCSAVNRRANPAAVVEARNGTADTSAATASARTWSRPDQ